MLLERHGKDCIHLLWRLSNNAHVHVRQFQPDLDSRLSASIPRLRPIATRPRRWVCAFQVIASTWCWKGMGRTVYIYCGGWPTLLSLQENGICYGLPQIQLDNLVTAMIDIKLDEPITWIQNRQRPSFKTETLGIKTKTKAKNLVFKTKTKTFKIQSWDVWRPRPKSRELHVWFQPVSLLVLTDWLVTELSSFGTVLESTNHRLIYVGTVCVKVVDIQSLFGNTTLTRWIKFVPANSLKCHIHTRWNSCYLTD